MISKRIAFSVCSASVAGLLLLISCSSSPLTSDTESPRETPVLSQRGMLMGDLEIRRDARVLLRLEVEIAQTAEERSRGLMNLESLPENSGMVFLNSQVSKSPFWMKDTKIPLDIAFWDEEGNIVDIQQMEPCTSDPCPLYHPLSEYVSAVEVNRGVLMSNDVEVGDRVLLRKRSANL